MTSVDNIAKNQLKSEITEFNVGDTVKVHVLIVEGEKERVQVFNGTVIARDHAGISETFTVRRLSDGLGVERVFPLHSPRVVKIEVVSRGDVCRGRHPARQPAGPGPGSRWICGYL